MKKQYKSRQSGPAFKKKRPMIRPGADKSLKNIFKKIGKPEKEAFTPDPFQLSALKAIEHSDCLVTAPTGAGKTWIAENVARKTLEQGGKVWYATPLKALTNSIHAGFSKLFGAGSVGILTGDIKENTEAPIIIGTTEILRNQLYDAMYTGEDLACDVIVLDEAHYLGDEDRGVVWEEIMIYMPSRIPLLLLSATIGNPFQIAGWLESIRGKRCEVIENTRRPVPLFPVFFHPSGTLYPLLKKTGGSSKPQLHQGVLSFLSQQHKPMLAPPGQLPPLGDILKVMHTYDMLPAIFFLKSRAECDQAIKLCTGEILARDPDRKEKLRLKLDELVAGNPHLEQHRQREFLEHAAVGAHHSGHLPAWKVVVETLMAEGLLDAMFATSTVAAGVNFPARSVVILNSDRFNGVEFMPLSTSEFQQMTGRAGRRGMDNIGFGMVLPGKFMNLRYIARLIHSPPIDIQSRIKIDFTMVLNLLLSHTPDQISTLLDKSFASYMISLGKKKGKLARKQFGHGMEFLWNDFVEHMNFLIKEAYVTPEGKLTDDGIWASKLRMDTPLLVAQSIRHKLLPQSDPALLASIIAAFVNEKEFTDDPLYDRATPQRLVTAFLEIRKKLRPFAVRMQEQGFFAPNLFIQPAALTYAWAHDTPWHQLMGKTDIAEGDFARLILRTAENLRQLTKIDDVFPRIAATAKESIDMILKEPVVTLYH